MAPVFTAEQALALAPDASSQKAARGLATARKWSGLGRNDRAVWGKCHGSAVYETRIDLAEPAFSCSCPSRKFPCKHGLALLLLYAADDAAVAAGEPPESVVAWLDKRDERGAKKEEKKEAAKAKEADPVAKAKRTEARANKIAGGIDELELWLRDLIRAGLAEVPSIALREWDRVAARMVDAQAPGLGNWVRRLSEDAGSGNGWQDRLLRRAGRLYLLLQAWKRVDTLPPDLATEVRTQIGLATSKDDVLALTPLHDVFYVESLDRREMPDGLIVQRIWLSATSSDRRALLLSFARPSLPFEIVLAPNSFVEANLHFYPSSWPERALIADQKNAEGRFPIPPGEQTILAMHQRYADALAANPWLDVMPAAITGHLLMTGENVYTLRDMEGNALPATLKEDDFWKLTSLTGGRIARVFGEWSGETLRVLSSRIAETGGTAQ